MTNYSTTVDPSEGNDPSIDGSAAALETDDDVLDSAHNVGLYQNSTDEQSGDVNVAEQIITAEKDLWQK